MIDHIKVIAHKGIATLHQPTALVESLILKRRILCKWPPVFIVGPPRSGTTLLYQLLMSAFHFSYIPNISNTWYMMPVTAARMGRLLCPSYSSSFSSVHGYEKGAMAPSEAGNIWNRWFPYEKREGFNYTPAHYLSKPAKNRIVTFVANVENMFNAPFLTKNVKMSVRIRPLLEMFPNALFVHMQRNPVHSAASLLNIRRKKGKSWWSVMPKEYPEIKKMSELEQVCHQVYYTEMNIKRDLQKVENNRLHEVNYAKLCTNPVQKLEAIGKFLTGHDIPADADLTSIPESFPPSRPLKGEHIEEKELEQIQTILDRIIEK
ncbi:MAG: sulfotransferase [candidate division KSB1 bacterium]|nr:sulfotransferase [candidate division KSB1 bacterium]